MKSSAGTIMLDAAASWHGNDMRLQYDVWFKRYGNVKRVFQRSVFLKGCNLQRGLVCMVGSINNKATLAILLKFCTFLFYISSCGAVMSVCVFCLEFFF